MAAWFPREAERLSPATVALIAKYLARHRLRQPPLLDALAAFLLRRAPQMDTKMIQKLVFPFSRTNYRPSNHPELFSQLESVLVQKAAASPLATVNILMSLVQLRHFPLAVLHKVFSPSFLDNVTSNPCGPIVRRYLSLLDVAVALEVQGYDGPRLGPQYHVCMFDGALTADEANHKYSYKGLVAEALRQLVGEEGYRQDAVVPPGYCADFLLQASGHLGAVLPRTSPAAAHLDPPDLQALASNTPSRSPSGQQGPGSPSAGRLLLPGGGGPCPLAPQGSRSLREEPPCSTAPCSSSPVLLPEPQLDLPEERRLLLATPGGTPGAAPGGTEAAAEEIHRIVLSVNDKWHYCQDSTVLVGSRAMRDRHLLLLGYHLVQVRGGFPSLLPPGGGLLSLACGAAGSPWWVMTGACHSSLGVETPPPCFIPLNLSVVGLTPALSGAAGGGGGAFGGEETSLPASVLPCNAAAFHGPGESAWRGGGQAVPLPETETTRPAGPSVSLGRQLPLRLLLLLLLRKGVSVLGPSGCTSGPAGGSDAAGA
ncbi:UNVERIFIED_CONTAM: hypothetical protein K2H54_003895 [Gekko kuhli]